MQMTDKSKEQVAPVWRKANRSGVVATSELDKDSEIEAFANGDS